MLPPIPILQPAMTLCPEWTTGNCECCNFPKNNDLHVATYQKKQAPHLLTILQYVWPLTRLCADFSELPHVFPEQN
jgi:hypothetical protein